MVFLVICLLALLYTKHPAFACILVVFYALSVFKRPGDAPEEKAPAEFLSNQSNKTFASLENSLPEARLRTEDIFSLAALRFELKKLFEQGSIDKEFYNQTVGNIDLLSARMVEALVNFAGDKYRREGLEAAWKLLVKKGLVSEGLPPWRQRMPASKEEVVEARKEEDFPTSDEHLAGAEVLEEITFTIDTAALAAEPAGERAVQIEKEPASEKSRFDPSDEKEGFAWKPAVPGALERALGVISGWPALIAPFLAQNIGWFIGGLCFVAGSVFLVSYTTGFAKALTVSIVLGAYTLLILWAGYQIRRRKPELEVSSAVLLSLGVFLIPLDIAALARMVAADRNILQTAVSFLCVASISAALYFATILVSGIMDSSLKGRHPKFFLGLSGLQLAVLLLVRFPSWPLLAGLHILLLGLLSYGLVSFTRYWLHSIFIEQRKIAYYAAGTLVYAAIVSFVHLTWGYDRPCSLPGGYYSPFIMALCGMLFYIDAQLKEWTSRHAFLSRLSFFLYGLSALALGMSADEPAARIVTLILAVVLYGTVLWQYLTLPPLYLLIGCLGRLYDLAVLTHVPHEWYFPAALPALGALLASSRRLQRRGSLSLSLACYRMWFGATVLLTGWSLFMGRSGLVPMVSALAAVGFLFYGMKSAPASPFGRGEIKGAVDLRNGPWLYVVTSMSAVAFGVAPRFAFLTWETQFCFGLLFLAALWAWLCFGGIENRERAGGNEVLLNSALASLALAVVLSFVPYFPDIAKNRFLPFILATASALVLWLGIKLRMQWLFYGTLVLFCAAGAVVKFRYFPGLGSGLALMLLALGVWILLWGLERAPLEIRKLGRQAALLSSGGRPLFMVFGKIPVFRNKTYEEILCNPLKRAMVILWLVGAVQLSLRAITASFGWSWTISAFLGAFLSFLLGGYFNLTCSVPLSMLLGLGAWLSAFWRLFFPDFAPLSSACVIYALIFWRLAAFCVTNPIFPKAAKFLHIGFDQSLAETYTHYFAYFLAVSSAFFSLAWCGLYGPDTSFFISISISSLFLWLAGKRCNRRYHSYTMLGICVLGSVMLYLLVFESIAPGATVFMHFSAKDTPLDLFLTLLGLFMLFIAGLLDSRAGTQDEDFDKSLYRKPLRILSILLALSAAGRQLIPALFAPGSIPDLFSVGVLVLSSMVLIISNRAMKHRFYIDLTGILVAVQAMLRLEAHLFHGGAVFSLIPADPGWSDQVLGTSFLTLVLAALAEKAAKGASRAEPYAFSLKTAAALSFIPALAGSASLYFASSLQPKICLLLSFLVLILCSFPLLSSLPSSDRIRGIAIPILSCAFYIEASALLGLSSWMGAEAIILGVFFWVSANFLIPRWNERWTEWAVWPDAWPWLGLLAVVSGFVTSSLWNSRTGILIYPFCLAFCALYFLLMLRNSNWLGFSWLSAILLCFFGIALNEVLRVPRLAGLSGLLLFGALNISFDCLIRNLLWANLLLRVVPLWQQWGVHISKKLKWQTGDPAKPFLFVPVGLFSLWLLELLLLLATRLGIFHLLFSDNQALHYSSVVPGGLLLFSFLHLWWLSRARLAGHAVFASLLCTLLGVWLGFYPDLPHLTLFLALFGGILFSAHTLWDGTKWGAEATESLRSVLSLWLVPSLGAAFAALVMIPHVTLAERLISVAVLMAAAGALGVRREQPGWMFASLAMFIIFVHGWPLLLVKSERVELLLPWYVLQTVLLTWLLLLGSDRIGQGACKGDGASGWGIGTAGAVISRFLFMAWPFTGMLALCELGLHGFFLIEDLVGIGKAQWLTGALEPSAILFSALLLLLMGVRLARKSHPGSWFYASVILCFATGVYVRLLLVGLAPAGVWDTAVLIGAGYVLFVLQQFTRYKPLSHVVLVLPLLALLTVPVQQASSHTAATLVSAGVLYISTYRRADQPLGLYLGLLAFNGAIYLWVPGWASRTRVFQLYIAPAAISVLILLHLQRRELKAKVLNSARLAAISILYACATVDVFLRGELAVFAVVLILSLAGVILGIALRIRAFLYSGIAFLAVNILCQLVLLFPEQRLGKAILLLVLGAIITGGMIWFNMKRERILQRIRIYRADLEMWD